jgi:hypothetical protein
MANVQEIIEAALELDPADLEQLLAEIAGRLVDPPISQEWLDAARARSAELASGATTAVPWSEVRERMWRKVNGASD